MLLLVDLPLVGNDGRSATTAAVDTAELAADPPSRFVESAGNESAQRGRKTSRQQGKSKVNPEVTEKLEYRAYLFSEKGKHCRILHDRLLKNLVHAPHYSLISLPPPSYTCATCAGILWRGMTS